MKLPIKSTTLWLNAITFFWAVIGFAPDLALILNIPSVHELIPLTWWKIITAVLAVANFIIRRYKTKEPLGDDGTNV